MPGETLSHISFSRMADDKTAVAKELAYLRETGKLNGDDYWTEMDHAARVLHIHAGPDPRPPLEGVDGQI